MLFRQQPNTEINPAGVVCKLANDQDLLKMCIRHLRMLICLLLSIKSVQNTQKHMLDWPQYETFKFSNEDNLFKDVCKC